MTDPRQQSDVGLRHIEIRGFRSARHVEFSPRRMCALVGEARAGKSTLLAAIRAVLDPESAPLTTADITRGESLISIRAHLASGDSLSLDGPPSKTETPAGPAPPVLFLSAADRAGHLVSTTRAEPTGHPAVDIFRDVLGDYTDAERDHSTTMPAIGLVKAMEQCCTAHAGGLVLLIEDPELYLRPQTQRYLYRLLREFSLNGNQVIYSTHSPAFLNVARLDELGFVTRGADNGTHVLHPEPVSAEEEFKLITEFDAERSEVFLAQPPSSSKAPPRNSPCPSSSVLWATTPIASGSQSSNVAGSQESLSSPVSAERWEFPSWSSMIETHPRGVNLSLPNAI